MEMAILSHIITLVVSVDTGEHLPTFEGVWGYVDPIWGQKGRKNPKINGFLRFSRDRKIMREISSMETARS